MAGSKSDADQSRRHGRWRHEALPGDGGLIATGAYSNGRPIGGWKAWWEDGKVQYERVFAPPGELASETTWTADGWKQHELKDGAHTNFLPDGGVESHITKTAHVDTYRDGRLFQQEQRTANGSILLNAWGEDGGQEIRDWAGSRMGTDGELGLKFRVRYRGGKPVRSP